MARTAKQIRLVTFSTLYPNTAQPNHGVFVENRLRHLIASGEVISRVVAPVPYFPFRSPRFGIYAQYAQVPIWEERHGLTLNHPRYPVIPKIGMNLSPYMLAWAALPAVRAAIKAQGGADLIDAHYLYPDGVAATIIGRALKLPVVMTARGNDVSLIPRYPVPRKLIQRACQRAAGIITVSAALKDGLAEMGVDPDRVTVLRNGVDLKLFRPLDRQATRRRLGLEGPTLISVGHLIERKGHDLIIEAMPSLPGFTLLIAGEGPEKAKLERRISELGLMDRVADAGRTPACRAARTLRRRRRAGSRLQPGRLGQCPAGSDGLRNARDRHTDLGQPRGRRQTRSRHHHDGTQSEGRRRRGPRLVRPPACRPAKPPAPMPQPFPGTRPPKARSTCSAG